MSKRRKPCDVVRDKVPCFIAATGRCAGRPYWEGRCDNTGVQWKEIKAADLEVCPWHERIRTWWVKEEKRKRMEKKPFVIYMDMTRASQEQVDDVKRVFGGSDD